MSGMQMRFVDDVEARRRESLLSAFRVWLPRPTLAIDLFSGTSSARCKLMARVPRCAERTHGRSCAARQLALILRSNEAGFQILRLRPRAAGRCAPAAQDGTGLPVEGLPAGRRASRAAGPGARGRVLSVLPRSRAPVQCLLQLLRRHEQRRGRGLPEGQRDRPSADLEGRRQRLGARHAARWLRAPKRAAARRTTRMPSFLGVPGGRARRTETRRAPQAAGGKSPGFARSRRRPPRRPRSRPASRSWSSATTPTPTAAIRAPRTSCAKSSKPITI